MIIHPNQLKAPEGMAIGATIKQTEPPGQAPALSSGAVIWVQGDLPNDTKSGKITTEDGSPGEEEMLAAEEIMDLVEFVKTSEPDKRREYEQMYGDKVISAYDVSTKMAPEMGLTITRPTVNYWVKDEHRIPRQPSPDGARSGSIHVRAADAALVLWKYKTLGLGKGRRPDKVEEVW